MGERELSSDAWARRYLDHMQDLIVVIDMATGVVIDINDAGAAGLLHRPDEILVAPARRPTRPPPAPA